MRRVHLSVIGLVSVGSLCPIDHKLLLQHIGDDQDDQDDQDYQDYQDYHDYPDDQDDGDDQHDWDDGGLGDRKEFLDNFKYRLMRL